MITVTAGELQKEFGHYHDMALKNPIFVTNYARETLVILSAEEYKRLKSFDNREVYAAKDIPSDLLEEIRKSDPPAWTKNLDHLME